MVGGRVVLVVVLAFLVMDPCLAEVNAAASADECWATSLEGFKEFLAPREEPLHATDRAHIEQQIEAKCRARPISIESFPKKVVEAIKAHPAVQFMLHKLDEKPEHKLKLVETHHYLATANLTGLLSAIASPQAPQARDQSSSSAPISAVAMLEVGGNDRAHGYFLAGKLLPFWVKGDPGGTHQPCYWVHYIAYIVSWIFVGAFVAQLLSHCIDGRWDGADDAMLGRNALLAQIGYSVVVLACGFLRENHRITMGIGSAETGCAERRRYIFNIGTVFLIFYLWIVASPKPFHITGMYNSTLAQRLNDIERAAEFVEATAESKDDAKLPVNTPPTTTNTNTNNKKKTSAQATPDKSNSKSSSGGDDDDEVDLDNSKDDDAAVVTVTEDNMNIFQAAKESFLMDLKATSSFWGRVFSRLWAVPLLMIYLGSLVSFAFVC